MARTPKLEVRLTPNEWERLERDRGEKSMDRSAYVRFMLFGVDPDARRERLNDEIGARRRAQAARVATMRDHAEHTTPPEPMRQEPPPPAAPPPPNGSPGVPSAAQVALQCGLSYGASQEAIETGRAKLDGERVLIDGKPCN